MTIGIVDQAEKDRRKAICGACSALQRQGGGVYCNRNVHREDGIRHVPWAIAEYASMVKRAKPHCRSWQDPIIVLRAPLEIVKQLRGRGLHTGNWRDPVTNLDRGLIAAYRMPAGADRERRLAEWASLLQREVDRDGRLVTAWHPNADAEELRRATRRDVLEIEVRSVAEAIAAIQGAGVRRDGVIFSPAAISDRDARALRRANDALPEPLKVFYHVACMGNWREVFAEQVSLLDSVGLTACGCVLGDPADVKEVAKYIEVLDSSKNLKRYEVITLQRAWKWAVAHPGGAVLYLHTKGVSAPQHAGKVAWRRLMDHHVIRRWEENLQQLRSHDLVGVCWEDDPRWPHFCGNFWMARCDWLARLKSPAAYRDTKGPRIAGNPWRRMCAELWVGSKACHDVVSLACRNAALWKGDRVFQVLESTVQESPVPLSPRMAEFVGKTAPEVVYTAIFGGCDSLRPLPKPFRQACKRAVCFTDSDLPAADGWEICRVDRPVDDPCRAARWYKLHPLEVFPDAGSFLWIDASYKVTGEMPTFAADTWLAADKHPWRTGCFAEGRFCRNEKLDEAERFDRQLANYEEAGMPKEWGLWETGVLFSRRCHETRTLFRNWWEHVETFSCRDQVSLPFILWRHLDGQKPMPLSRKSFHWRGHARSYKTH